MHENKQKIIFVKRLREKPKNFLVGKKFIIMRFKVKNLSIRFSLTRIHKKYQK